jgi:hypothetical protein
MSASATHYAKPARLVLALLASSTVALAQDSPRTYAVFDVPLKGSLANIDRMTAQRGYRQQARATICQEREVCKNISNLENIPGTDFLNQVWGWRAFPDRKESYRFVFTAPPKEGRIWSAGLDQEFGKWTQPSPAAPLLRDVVQELTARYGQPAATFGDGGRQLRSGEQPWQYWWIWDARGNPVPWGPQVRDAWHQRSPCYAALAKAATYPGTGLSGSGNASVTDPAPFRLARQGNCAVAVRVELGQTRGLVHKLSIRMVDFQGGHDALFSTTRHISALRSSANRDRSERNRPDF